MAEWWHKCEAIPLARPNFQKIIEFYLFKCPCETESGSRKKNNKVYSAVSNQSITFRNQGWIKGKLNTLRSAMINTASSGNLQYKSFPKGAKIDILSDNMEKESHLSDQHFEMIIIAERADMSITCSIFYYIRNALAHGSFGYVTSSGKRTYYFESAKKGAINARIRLREETLLKWIEYFNYSPSELRAQLAANRHRRNKS